MSRASVIPELSKEPLVVIRASFLSLCSGDHCAAALLNDFVYWHDWCVNRERHDNTAQAADPEHHSAEPGYWFWKTGEDLENDLLGLFSGKKIRAATTLLIEKGYVETRNNPKDPFDRTKQFRLLTDRLRADLDGLSGVGDWTTSSAPLAPALPVGTGSDCPSRFGKNAECTESTTYVDLPRCGEAAGSTRQKDRIDAEKAPDVLAEITCSENTSSSSSEPPSTDNASPEMMRTTMLLPAKSPPESGKVEIEPSTAEQAIAQWAIDARIRRLRNDNTIGRPPAELERQWAAMIQEHGYTAPAQVAAIMTAARSRADHAARGEWRAWSFLTLQVQLAVEQYRPEPPVPLTAEERSFTVPEFAEPEPPSAEQIRSQLEELRQTIRQLRGEYRSATYNNPYSSRGPQIEQQIRTYEQRMSAMKGILEGVIQAEALACKSITENQQSPPRCE